MKQNDYHTLLAGLLFLSVSVQGAELYIAPDGADTNPDISTLSCRRC